MPSSTVAWSTWLPTLPTQTFHVPHIELLDAAPNPVGWLGGLHEGASRH